MRFLSAFFGFRVTRVLLLQANFAYIAFKGRSDFPLIVAVDEISLMSLKE